MKKAYIIAHTHWDREWYMPLRKHQMYLVDMMDDIIKTLENNTAFPCFHLDGNYNMIEDYCQLRPSMKHRLLTLLREGRLLAGPFYVCNDAFLTSNEANVRNLLIGSMLAQKYHNYMPIGYYPDMFGIPAQIPQLLEDANIHSIVFGRGLKMSDMKTNGAINQAEFNMTTPHGKPVLGIFLANWYDNANEIPIHDKAYWDQRIVKEECFRSGDLLFMNGCDHQPIQKNLVEAVANANQIYQGKIHFEIESLSNFVRSVYQKQDTLPLLSGELDSQAHEGYESLANVASARIHVKQKNVQCQNKLEKVVEPLYTLLYFQNIIEYPQDLLYDTWKMLLQNHPHDSICGCSVDEVHREDEIRYQNIEITLDYLMDKAKNYAPSTASFSVLNTTDGLLQQKIEVELIRESLEFGFDSPSPFFAKDIIKQEYVAIDEDGVKHPCEIIRQDKRFCCELSLETFRKSKVNETIKLVFYDCLKAYEAKTYDLEPVCKADFNSRARVFDLDELQVSIQKDGSFSVLDKRNEQTYESLLYYRDTSECGNSYEHVELKDQEVITTLAQEAEVDIVSDNEDFIVIQMKQMMWIPIAIEGLEIERKKMVTAHQRVSKQSKTKTKITIQTRLTIYRHVAQIDVDTTFINTAKDHRLQVCMKHNSPYDWHEASTLFEWTKRDNRAQKQYTGDFYPRKMSHSCVMHNPLGAMIFTGEGLHEYEIVDNELRVTLLRAFGEIAELFHFETPEAQMLQEMHLQYRLSFATTEDILSKKHQAHYFKTPLVIGQFCDFRNLHLPKLFEYKQDTIVVSGIKKHQYSDAIVVRVFNPNVVDGQMKVQHQFNVYRSNVLEERQEKISNTILVRGKQIVTLILEVQR